MRGRATPALLAALACLPAGGCGHDDPHRPADPDVVLVIDGIAVRRAEWNEYVPYLKTVEPERGENTLRQMLLTDVLLQRAIAQRMIGPQIERARAQAEEFCKVVKAQGSPAMKLYGAEESVVARGAWPVPMDRMLFTLAEGQVSDPIALPAAIAVVGILERTTGPMPPLDKVQAAIKLFPAVEDRDLLTRIKTGVVGLKGRITWLDPAWQDSVPAFLKTDT